MKSVFTNGIRSVPPVVVNVPRPRPVPQKPPFAIEYERLDDLVARPVRVLAHGFEPDVDALLHARDRRGTRPRAPRDEEPSPIATKSARPVAT